MFIIKDKLLSKGYSVVYTDAVLEAMLDKGVDSIKGARGLSQIRRELIEDTIADKLIHDNLPRGSLFHIDYDINLILKINKPKKEKGIQQDDWRRKNAES